jgi:molybdopterin-guanine dinucleotide biosynthesis protein MobB
VVPIIRILGRSGSGKTTFIEAFVRACPSLSVVVVKHSRTTMDPPTPMKDTARHFAAGAVASLGLSPGYAELLVRPEQAIPFERALAALGWLLQRPPDLVLIEGARDRDLPTILLGPLPPRATRGTILLRLPARPVFDRRLAEMVLAEVMALKARVALNAEA